MRMKLSYYNNSINFYFNRIDKIELKKIIERNFMKVIYANLR